MATNLIDTVKDYLTPDVMQKISSIIGETPSTAQRGIDSVVPALLTQVADLSSSTDGANQLSNLMDQATNNGNLLSNLPGQLSGGTVTQTLLNTGSGILSTLFGDRLNSVIAAITSALGTGSASVSSLMKIAAPLVLAILAKERTARGMGTAGLASLLAEQKGSLARLLPAGLVGALAIGSGPLRQSAGVESTFHESRTNDKTWLWSVVGLVALALLAYAFWGRDTGIKPESVKQGVASLKQMTLPSGKVLNVREGSFYYNLADFLANPTDTAAPRSFVFENLNFEFGSAKLTPESVPTLNDLVDILKAYPSVHVKLEGYTDNVGDAADNKKLSLARAEATKEIMVASGIGAQRITTTGYGDERPIASNDSEEGKAKNRRLELVVERG
jgi:outer membrane protein OmpA-like peptidoglycan-associated protein